MSLILLDLPAEILVLIFRYLRADGLFGTLSVSSRWRELAEPVAYEYARVMLVRRDPLHELWNLPFRPIQLLHQHNQHLAILMPCYTIQDEVHPGVELVNRSMPLRFEWLSDQLLSQLSRLKSVSIRRGARLPQHDLKWIGLSTGGNDQYIRVRLHEFLPPFARILSTLSALSFVGIDLRPKDLDQSGSASERYDCHCGELRALMRQVKTFYLRLPCICPRIFQSAGDEPSRAASTRQAIINTSMGFDDDSVIEHATGCAATMGFNKTINPAAMETEARSLAEKSLSLETLRIVYHTYPLGLTEAYDAVSRRRFRVNEHRWTEKGIMLDDETSSDSEPFDHVDVFSDSSEQSHDR